MKTKACTRIFFNLVPPEEEIQFTTRYTVITQEYRQIPYYSNSKKNYSMVLQQLRKLKRTLIHEKNTSLKKRKPEYDPLHPQSTSGAEK